MLPTLLLQLPLHMENLRVLEGAQGNNINAPGPDFARLRTRGGRGVHRLRYYKLRHKVIRRSGARVLTVCLWSMSPSLVQHHREQQHQRCTPRDPDIRIRWMIISALTRGLPVLRYVANIYQIRATSVRSFPLDR